jgi:ditrans,polycis-polyprenyl diphosphate synthase
MPLGGLHRSAPGAPSAPRARAPPAGASPPPPPPPRLGCLDLALSELGPPSRGLRRRAMPPLRAAERATAAPPVAVLGIARERLPAHIAVIMDGNSRWAAARGQPAAFGHERGVEALRATVRCCLAWGVPCLTAFAFSAENWHRGEAEVALLLGLIERALAAELEALRANGVRLVFIGDIAALPASLRRAVAAAEAATAANARLHLTVALSYSARRDLASAAAELARQAAAGALRPEDITPELLAAQLSTARALPERWRAPDLVLRTSGEQRLSDFLLWESAWSELAFSDALWPDVGEAELRSAVLDYAGRERRFGRRGAG